MATQAERRATTRAKLLDAAVACLVDLGYAGTTTARVCARAGMSSGALFQHFPTKADLLAEAARTVLDDARADAAAAFLADESHADEPVERAVRLAWDIYRRDDLVAILELFVVGRTDPELAERLRAINRPHRRALHDLARMLLPDEAQHREDFDDVIDTVLDSIGGITLGVGTDVHADNRDAEIDVLVAATRALLLGPDHATTLRNRPMTDVEGDRT